MNDLAIYSVQFDLAGMKLSGAPEGVGDRSLRFELKLDPTDAEAANEVWYQHLQVMLGDDEVTRLRQAAELWSKKR